MSDMKVMFSIQSQTKQIALVNSVRSIVAQRFSCNGLDLFSSSSVDSSSLVLVVFRSSNRPQSSLHLLMISTERDEERQDDPREERQDDPREERQDDPREEREYEYKKKNKKRGEKKRGREELGSGELVHDIIDQLLP